uniref:Uncharacterized protein n=1 Tax=Anguilla anguilla TaxID=7936 RepID=A0A0E9UKC4_ANGAN
MTAFFRKNYKQTSDQDFSVFNTKLSVGRLLQ